MESMTELKMDDPDHVYVTLYKDRKVDHTKELMPMVFADYDSEGTCIGVEFTEAVKLRVSKVE